MPPHTLASKHIYAVVHRAPSTILLAYTNMHALLLGMHAANPLHALRSCTQGFSQSHPQAATPSRLVTAPWACSYHRCTPPTSQPKLAHAQQGRGVSFEGLVLAPQECTSGCSPSPQPGRPKQLRVPPTLGQATLPLHGTGLCGSFRAALSSSE